MASSATTQPAKRPIKASGFVELQVQKAVARIADSDCPVLIVGEPGAGKRSVAAQIHAQSHRPRAAMIEIPAAEATGQALAEVIGARETVYLTEIGDLGLELQEWLIDRYQVKTDKDSGIVNDPNDWCDEHNDPRYIVDLVKRIVTVSVETMKIVDGLPELDLK